MENTEGNLKVIALNIMILKIVDEKDVTGEELPELVEKRSQGYLKLKKNSVFSILYTLDSKDLIRSYWSQGAESNGLPQKNYAITSKGKDVLRNNIDYCSSFIKVISELL